MEKVIVEMTNDISKLDGTQREGVRDIFSLFTIAFIAMYDTQSSSVIYFKGENEETLCKERIRQ